MNFLIYNASLVYNNKQIIIWYSYFSSLKKFLYGNLHKYVYKNNFVKKKRFEIELSNKIVKKTNDDVLSRWKMNLFAFRWLFLR